MKDINTRFWTKVSISDHNSCWEWLAHKDRYGYGAFSMNKKDKRAHRIAWTLTHGEIPEGLQVLHHCDNPSCCNPAHLFLGTHDDNMLDMAIKKRNGATKHPEIRLGENNGHSKLTEREVYDIRYKYEIMGYSRKELQEQYNISKGGLYGIIAYINWKHVGKPIDDDNDFGYGPNGRPM